MLKNIILFGIYLVLLFLPLYLLKVEIWWVPFTFLELMIYGLFIVWVIEKIKAKNYQLPTTSYQLPILLIFIGLTLSTLLSDDIYVSAGIWKGWFIAPLLFFLVFTDIIKNRAQIKKTLIVLTLSGFFVAVISLWYWFLGNLTYDGRLKAFYLSPSHLAMYLTPILILSFALWNFTKNKWQKIALFITHYTLLVTIYLTYSYGAWLGLIGAVVFLLLINYPSTSVAKGDLRSGSNKLLPERGRGPSRRLIFYGFIFFVLLLFLIFSQLQSEKAQNLLNFSHSSLESRLMIWRAAVEIIKDQPIIGIGPGLFQKYYLEYQPKFEPYLEWAAPQPHNLFLAFWLQTGLIGLIGFVWLLVLFFRISLRNFGSYPSIRFARSGNKLYGKLIEPILPERSERSERSRRLSVILIAAMIYILIHGLIDTTYWKNDLSIIFWLIIALNHIASRLSFPRKISNSLLETKRAG